MVKSEPELIGFRTSNMQTVGFVGNCNCNGFVKQRLDAFLLFHATACHGLRVVAGVGTSFGRCVLERIAGLRWRLPQMRITALLTVDEWEAYSNAVECGRENQLVRAVLQADEVVLLRVEDCESEDQARHRMLVAACNLIIEGYKRADDHLRADLDQQVAQAECCVSAFSLSGPFVRKITFAISGMCRVCGLVPPGDLSRTLENKKEE